MEETTMRKVYLKPAIEVMEDDLSQMLCASVMYQGEDNVAAGARASSDWSSWEDGKKPEVQENGMSSNDVAWDRSW